MIKALRNFLVISLTGLLSLMASDLRQFRLGEFQGEADIRYLENVKHYASKATVDYYENLFKEKFPDIQPLIFSAPDFANTPAQTFYIEPSSFFYSARLLQTIIHAKNIKESVIICIRQKERHWAFMAYATTGDLGFYHFPSPLGGCWILTYQTPTSVSRHSMRHEAH